MKLGEAGILNSQGIIRWNSPSAAKAIKIVSEPISTQQLHSNARWADGERCACAISEPRGRVTLRTLKGDSRSKTGYASRASAVFAIRVYRYLLRTEITFPKLNEKIYHEVKKHLAMEITPDHLLLDSAPNLGPPISRWEINKFENC